MSLMNLIATGTHKILCWPAIIVEPMDDSKIGRRIFFRDSAGNFYEAGGDTLYIIDKNDPNLPVIEEFFASAGI